ncbi:type VI secretion system tube protein TssD [Morganella morganii]|uniref:type VI secretion system tube protein TssD n=1 Tax=Morganella morganii TaxID=582 RepID=UPI0031E9AD61
MLSSISDNELPDCVFDYYRINQQGILINYKRIRLTKASVIRIANQSPDSLTHNDLQSVETISLKYESITYQHISAGTSGYSIRNESVR